MSIFTKPLSQLVTADLQELLDEGAVENVRLEFKLQEPIKEETLKKLSSFANTYGGYMVVGARADSKDGRIQELPGIDVVAGYKQRVVQWCFDGASPPLVVEVSDPIPVGGGSDKVCYVVHAVESDVAPHFLNGRKGIWIRIDEFSGRYDAHLANEDELRHLLDRRKLVIERRARLLERAKKRFDTYIAKKHTDLGGNRTNLGSLLEFWVVPRFPARQLCPQEELKAKTQQSWTSWRQVQFPDPGSPVLSQHESAIVLDAARGTSIFEVNLWGMLYYGVRVNRNDNEIVGINLFQVVGYVLLFIRHAATMLRVLGYVGPIVFEIALSSIRGMPWHFTSNLALGTVTRPGSELDDNVAFSISTTIEEMCEKPDKIAMDVLRYVLFSVNSPEIIDTPQKLKDLVRKGYEFNYWQMPPNHRT
jgi:hypothetical protein